MNYVYETIVHKQSITYRIGSFGDGLFSIIKVRI